MVMLRPFSTAIVFSVWAAAAQAQTAHESESVRADPKALLEWVWGSNAGKKETDQSGEEDRLDPDRPHFPEASTTVGKGRSILESGYTLTKNGSSLLSHSSESLLRTGIFANWFEFRIGQNYLNQRQIVQGTMTSTDGAQDLYVGTKLALTEQKGVLPAVAVIPQMSLPTGSRAVTAGRILPGLNVDCAWDVIKNFFGIELLVANNLVKDDVGRTRHEFSTGLTSAFQVTKRLEAFVEWDAFYTFAGAGTVGPRHYAVGGLVYFITPNFEVDVRAGVGLNHLSNDFLTGVGFAARY
jgi:hypothetical protein